MCRRIHCTELSTSHYVSSLGLRYQQMYMPFAGGTALLHYLLVLNRSSVPRAVHPSSPGLPVRPCPARPRRRRSKGGQVAVVKSHRGLYRGVPMCTGAGRWSRASQTSV